MGAVKQPRSKYAPDGMRRCGKCGALAKVGEKCKACERRNSVVTPKPAKVTRADGTTYYQETKSFVPTDWVRRCNDERAVD